MTDATFIRDLPRTASGAEQKLYRLSESRKVTDWDPTDGDAPSFDHVVTSAVSAYSGPETYVFPANSDGEIVDWGELDGSFRGSFDHEKAIAGFVAAS